jgi:hypothetical protein
MKLLDLFCIIADAAIEIQRSDGSFPPGTNVYYNDPETPVRNTSHWLITMLKVYKYTKIKKYKVAAIKAVQYLLSKESRPMNASFWCRKNPNKNFCNGTVGQAFTIEALALAYEILEIYEVKDVAETVFLLHPFDEQNALWRCVAVDGSYMDIDSTFNHQLWFAVAGAELWRVGGNEEIGRRVSLFIDSLSKNMGVHKLFHKGLIYHFILRYHFPNVFNKNVSIYNFFRTCLSLFKQNTKSEIIRATRYHGYSLWAFPILKNIFPEKEYWNTKHFKSVVNFFSTKDFKRRKVSLGIDQPNSKYKFENQNVYEAYGVFYLSDLNDKIEKVEELLSTHFDNEFDQETNMVNKNTSDKYTQAARIYELLRLPNVEIQLANLTYKIGASGN